MKLAIVGTRTFHDYNLMVEEMKSYEGQITMIISGGAMGADRLAEIYAKEYNVPIKIFRANWTKYGKRAGPMRNQEIVAEADALIAFWDGDSPGTKSSIDFAEKKGIDVKIVQYK